MPRVTKYQQHAADWRHCTRCQLSKTRKNVCLLRGKIPADILFIGEAPGVSENTLGRPFVGPAGKLLDDIIVQAAESSGIGDRLTFGFTNLVGCIPLIDGDKATEPPKEAISACAPRLEDLYKISLPVGVVLVGRLAEKHVPKILPVEIENMTQIVHPAAILRAEKWKQPLAIQQAVATLTDFFYEMNEKAVPF